jgi:hypothetical protein
MSVIKSLYLLLSSIFYYTKGKVWNPNASSTNLICWCKLWCYAHAISINATLSHLICEVVAFHYVICVMHFICQPMLDTYASTYKNLMLLACSVLSLSWNGVMHMFKLFQVLCNEGFIYMHWSNSSMHLMAATTWQITKCMRDTWCFVLKTMTSVFVHARQLWLAFPINRAMSKGISI